MTEDHAGRPIIFAKGPIYQINNGRNRGSDIASGSPWARVRDDSDHKGWMGEGHATLEAIQS